MLLVSLASESAAWRVTSDGTCILREGQKRVDELCRTNHLPLDSGSGIGMYWLEHNNGNNSDE